MGNINNKSHKAEMIYQKVTGLPVQEMKKKELLLEKIAEEIEIHIIILIDLDRSEIVG